MNLHWRLTHLIPMEWDDAIKFQYGEYKLPTIKQLQEAFNQGIKGFESRFFGFIITQKDVGYLILKQAYLIKVIKEFINMFVYVKKYEI